MEAHKNMNKEVTKVASFYTFQTRKQICGGLMRTKEFGFGVAN